MDTATECIYEREAGRTDRYGPQEMVLKLVKNLTDTTYILPSPAGLVGCCPLNFLYKVNLKFRVRAPNGCCIL